MERPDAVYAPNLKGHPPEPTCRVAVRACGDYQNLRLRATLEGLALPWGGWSHFIQKGDRVLIKPNFIAAKCRSQAAQTDPALVLETARILKDLGAKPFLADSPAWNTLKKCVKILDLETPLRRLDVPVVAMTSFRRVLIDGAKVAVSSVALEADKILNLPKLKTHQQLGATFAVKNMFGCVCGKEKAYWHFARGDNPERFCRLLIGIYKLLNPVFNVIDGIVAMEGPGPIRGRARPLGVCVAGIDPIACERVCCDLIGIHPDQLAILQTAGRMDFGCQEIERIRIEGDDPRLLAVSDFVLPERIPIRFSLTHVCKSILRQGYLICRSAFQSDAKKF
ncbi:MAG: DUF362 domain-containing protein [Sedimentisphaerales bacterium]|nr:DUF362 domain-containing protein [Sedimentisphaerales bacterium]